MRNDIFIRAYAEKISDFHYNLEARKAFIKPGEEDTLFITKNVMEWHQKLVADYPKLLEAYKDHQQIVDMLKLFEKTFLFEGSLEHFKSLVPHSEVVLSHNDGQENNLLSSLENPKNLMLIDYEYVGLNPRAFDLANYCNETALDNAYPLKNGIAYFLENYIHQDELTLLLKEYLVNVYRKFYKGDKSKTSEEAYIE